VKPLNLNRTFKEFLKAGYDRKAFGDSPESDFAFDSLKDPSFRDFGSWEELRDYLLFHGACDEAVDAGQKLFKKWKASQ
jgi:hypothetical protein